ncbi:MAG TPA: hypothetical protein VIG33_14430 [Pseudobdellovibrionaceae bacterium]|jgi:hypothetical protein
MLRYRFVLIALLASPLLAEYSLAKDIPVQGRFFAGTTSVDPQNVNETIEAQSLKKMDKVSQFGFEVTYPLLNYLDVGARYTKSLVHNDENPSDINTEYSADLNQDSVLLLARIPFVKSSSVHVDVFAGFGGSNTTFKVKTASQDGEFTRKAVDGWYASPYAAYGASVGVGYKHVFFVIEGGFETNKVDGFTRSGSASTNIETLALSGSYVSIGIMLDGVPGSVK